MADFIPSPPHEVFCSALSLLPFSLGCQRCKFLMLPHVTELGQADLQPGGDYWKSDFKELLLWSCELEKMCTFLCV